MGAADETMRDTLARVATTEVDAGLKEPLVPVNLGPDEEEPSAVFKPNAEKPAAEGEGKPAAEKPAAEAKPGEKPAAEAKPAVKPGEKPAAEAKPAVKPEAKPAVATTRAPESWKPAVREKFWGQLPPEVQSEVARREREIDTTLRQTAEARHAYADFNKMAEHYKDFFASEKGHPFQTIGNLVSVANTLRFAQPAQRAQMMASVIQSFDIDIELLDKALAMVHNPDPAARTAAQANTAMEQAIAKHLAPVKEFMGHLQSSQQVQRQQAQQNVVAEIQAFAADPANEHFETVKDTMADIMEAAANRGVQITLSEAYKRAILAHSDLAEGYIASQVAQNGDKASAPANEAERKAGLSITGAPSGSDEPPASDGSITGDIRRSIALLNRK